MKPIRFSRHALERMRLRGATVTEVRDVVGTASRDEAKHNRRQAQKTFEFGLPSPVNQQVYHFKTVRVIFVDEPEEIVVISVLVYYGDGETVT